jgi:hypothetical protein
MSLDFDTMHRSVRLSYAENNMQIVALALSSSSRNVEAHVAASGADCSNSEVQ